MKKTALYRTLPILLCLVICFSIFSAAAFADSTGWRQIQGKWYYLQSDGSYLEGWQTIDGKTYYFAPEMLTKVQHFNNSEGEEFWYLFGEDGAWITTPGWYSVTWYGEDQGSYDNWYYVTENNGRLYEGWFNDGGNWYYMNPYMCFRGYYENVDGSGNTYVFAEDGRLLTNGWNSVTFDDGTGWWYLDANGVPYTGWQMIDGSWYYFSKDGGILFINGPHNADGIYYCFDQGGHLCSGWYSYYDPDVERNVWIYADENGVVSQGWINDNGTWYYQNFTTWEEENGTHYLFDLMKDGTYTIDGAEYTFDANGVWIENNGSEDSAQSGSWVDGGGVWWYQFADGSWAYGWQEINGTWYYFDENGVMLSNTVIDGYTLDASGAWVA